MATVTFKTLQKACLGWRQCYYLHVSRDCLSVVFEVNEEVVDYGSRIGEDWKRSGANLRYVPSIIINLLYKAVSFFYSYYPLGPMD
jgi:hypothetical protein